MNKWYLNEAKNTTGKNKKKYILITDGDKIIEEKLFSHLDNFNYNFITSIFVEIWFWNFIALILIKIL